MNLILLNLHSILFILGDISLRTLILKRLKSFAFFLLLFPSFPKIYSQETKNDKHRILSFEYSSGGTDLTVYGAYTPTGKDMVIDFSVKSPRIGVFLNRNLELGVQGIFISMRDDYTLSNNGKGHGFGYFVRYYPPKLYFYNKLKKISTKLSFEGHPYFMFNHAFTNVSLINGVANYYDDLRVYNVSATFGTNLKIYSSLYASLAIGIGKSNYAATPVFLSSFFALGYVFKK